MRPKSSPFHATNRRLLLLSAGALTLALVTSGCAVDDAAPDEVASEAAAIVAPPIDTSGITWSMQPRAALGAASYHVADGFETYGNYAHPTGFTVNLSWTPPPVAPGGPFTVVPQYQWVVSAAAGQSTGSYATAWTTTIAASVPVTGQGRYDVKLYKRPLLSGAVASLVTSTTIDVKDIVIVDLGDSMASGEGDADQWRRYRRTYQLPNALPVPFGPALQYGDVVPEVHAGVDYPLGATLGAMPWTGPVWLDATCHRSMNSGIARAAVEFEQRNPHYSVTFLDYACSGAKTENLWLTPQNSGRAHQLGNLKHDVDNRDGTYRKVDYLIMSIGINDLRFHDIMANCLDFRHGGCEEDEGEIAQRFLTLDRNYDALQAAIRTQVGGFVDQVSIIDYPATNVFKNQQGQLEACGFTDGWDGVDDSYGIPVPKNLSHDELAWLLSVAERLKAMAKQNAKAHDWAYIDGIDAAFDARGYCAPYPSRYYDVFTESKKKQGDEQGVFHPNNFGYTAMGHVIADYLSAFRYPAFPLWGDAISWTDGFSNPAGWAFPQYLSTIRYPDVNGDGKDDVCGRSATGIFCALSNGTSFGPATRWADFYTDAQGFNLERYYSTIGFPDLDNDGKADICGRGAAGMYCALSNGTSFNTPILSSPTFSDANGFTNPALYKSIRYGDVDGDHREDICAERDDGIWCVLGAGWDYLYLGPAYPRDTAATANPYSGYSMFGPGGANAGPHFYTTLAFPDVDGDGIRDVCGHVGSTPSSEAIFCSHGTRNTFDHDVFFNHEPGFGEAEWYSNPSYYSTLAYPDVNGDGKADVCGRAAGGIQCAVSNGHTFTFLRIWTSHFGDHEGWGTDPSYYGTLRFGDVNGDGKDDVCARGSSGVYCAVSDGTAFIGYEKHEGNFTNAKGFAGATFYPTMALADLAGNGQKKICMRGYWGIFCQP